MSGLVHLRRRTSSRFGNVNEVVREKHSSRNRAERADTAQVVVGDEQAPEVVGRQRNGTVYCCCYSGCRTRQLIVTCRVGELAYRPQLAQPMTPPKSWALATWRLLDLDWSAWLAVCMARLDSVWRRHPLIRQGQVGSPETSRLSARLMFDQPTEPHVSVIIPHLLDWNSTDYHSYHACHGLTTTVLLNSTLQGEARERRCSRDPPHPCPCPMPHGPWPLAPLPPAVPARRARESHLRRWMQGWHWPPVSHH